MLKAVAGSLTLDSCASETTILFDSENIIFGAIMTDFWVLMQAWQIMTKIPHQINSTSKKTL